MTGGYTHCACRDCFETAIGEPGEAFCHDCEAADCGTDNACQVDHCSCCGEFETETNNCCESCEYGASR